MYSECSLSRNTFLSVIAAVLSRDDLIAFRQSMTSCISAVDAQLESWLASLEPLAVSFDIGTVCTLMRCVVLVLKHADSFRHQTH